MSHKAVNDRIRRKRQMRDHARNRAIRQKDGERFADDLEKRTGSRSAPDLVMRRDVPPSQNANPSEIPF
jgi:hypothetical protein